MLYDMLINGQYVQFTVVASAITVGIGVVVGTVAAAIHFGIYLWRNK
jgi:uncharacterized membrane protein YczE